MTRTTFLFILTLLCLNVGAQQSFTTILQSERSGRGRVTLHQSSTITDLVNGTHTVVSASPVSTTESDITDGDTPMTTTRQSGQRIKMNGFRIQVYAGGGSRQSRQQAESAARQVKSLLPGESVYTNFVSPRWICRAGDYRSYEEAFNALHTLQQSGNFSDAVIVKSKVQVYID